MKVKMLKTNWPHLNGDVAEVKKDVAERWVKRGIAEEVHPVKTLPKPVKKRGKPVEIVEQTPTVVEPDVIEDDGPELEEMTINELRDLARKEGVEGIWSKNKDALIVALKGENHAS